MIHSGWSPLFQTIVWVLFIAILLVIFWRKIEILVGYILRRIERGADVDFGPFKVGSPPAALRRGKTDVVTAEGTAGAVAPPGDIETRLLNKGYPTECIQEDFYLIHEAQMIRERTPGRVGLYRVRVWLETEDDASLQQCNRIVYRLHDTFSQKVIATEARDKNFELWLNVYGEFTIVAYVERSAPYEPLWLSRYLELHGRPPD